MSVAGPITRRVADSAAVFDAIKDGGPSYTQAAEARGRRRIAVSVRTPPLTGLQADAEQLGVVTRIAERLRELGHDVIERELEYTAAQGMNVVARYLHGIAAEARKLPHHERHSRRTRGYVRMGAAIPGPMIERVQRAATADAEHLGRVFEGGVDAVLTPMFTRRPPRIREYEGRSAMWTLTGSIRFVPYCGAFNHTGQPAAAVPAGSTPDGFPLAVQLVAPPDGEPTLLALAAELEQALGWPDHLPPLAR